ncbi:MAG: ABC transporter permease [Candidatus Woesearchaeota archaeon]
MALEKKRMEKQETRQVSDFEMLKEAKIRPQSKLQFLIKLFAIITKDYRLIWRSTTSMLIFILGPLIIMFLVSIGFNTSSLVGLSVSAYSEEYSAISESLISNLSDSQFNVVKMSSEEECIEAVKYRDFQVCIIFPKGLVLDNSANNKLDIYVDNSRLNIANQITEKLSAKVSIQADQISAGLVNNMLSSLDNINRETAQGKTLVDSLKTSNKQATVQLDSMVDNFEGFDFEYGTLSTSAIYSEIENIRDRYNLSSSVFTTMKSEISAMQEAYSSTASKLDTASETAGALKDAGRNVAGLVSGEKDKIETLDASFSTIESNVGLVKITNVESIVSPLRTNIHPLSLKKNYLLFTFPNLLVLLIMVVAILMSSSTMVREQKSLAYFRNFISPTFDGLYVLGQFISIFSVILVQLLMVLGIASLFLSGITWQVYLIIGSILLIFATVFIFLGMGIGYLFSTEEGVTIGAISVALVSLLFSNAILPIEALSGFLRKAVMYNPFVIAEMILKRVILFDTNVAAIRELVLILLAFVAGAFIFCIIAREVSKRVKH